MVRTYIRFQKNQPVHNAYFVQQLTLLFGNFNQLIFNCIKCVRLHLQFHSLKYIGKTSQLCFTLPELSFPSSKITDTEALQLFVKILRMGCIGYDWLYAHLWYDVLIVQNWCVAITFLAQKLTNVQSAQLGVRNKKPPSAVSPLRTTQLVLR